MLGAIIGDIVGSRFEADNHKSKEFDLFTQNSCPTAMVVTVFGTIIIEASVMHEMRRVRSAL